MRMSKIRYDFLVVEIPSFSHKVPFHDFLLFS